MRKGDENEWAANTSTYQIQSRGRRLPAMLAATLVAAVEGFRLRRATRQLEAFPDYLLHYIGLDRCEINSVATFRGRDLTRRCRP
jgi:uncharacterized protein YjiS (DUF1127 family)